MQTTGARINCQRSRSLHGDNHLIRERIEAGTRKDHYHRLANGQLDAAVTGTDSVRCRYTIDRVDRLRSSDRILVHLLQGVGGPVAQTELRCSARLADPAFN